MTIFAAHDFEDGTLGPFELAGIQAPVVIKPDPTSRASGLVCATHYENFPEVGNFDCNQAISPKSANSPGLKLGQELWFGGRFYLDTDGAFPAIRKFAYWGWSNDSWGFQHAFNLILSSANSVAAPIPPGTPIQWLISAHLTAQDGSSVGCFGPGEGNAGPNTWYGPANITLKAWHKLKLQLKLNTSFTAQDGVLRIWFNDVLLFESTDMHWTDPSWTDDPATYQWVDYRVGQQLNGSNKMVEDRYWDDVIFATTEAEVETFMAGGGTGGGGTDVLTSLVLTPTSLSVDAGATQSLAVVALNQNGTPMTLPSLTLHTTSGFVTLDAPSGGSITIHGVTVGADSVWVTSGAVESNHVGVTVTEPPTSVASLTLLPNALTCQAGGTVSGSVGAKDSLGRDIAVPTLQRYTSNSNVANITSQSGNGVTIEALEAGVAHVWLGFGAILSPKVTIFVNDPAGGKGHRGRGPGR